MEITLRSNSTLTLPLLRNKLSLDGVSFPISGDAKHRDIELGELVELAKTTAYTNKESRAANTLKELNQGVERFKTNQQPENLTPIINCLEQLELDIEL